MPVRTYAHLFIVVLALFLFVGCQAPERTAQPNRRAELVNLGEFAPTLVIDSPYATADNFVGRRIYPRNELFLERGAAERLRRVQAALSKQGLGLKVLDGYRPHRVQYRLWEIMPDPRYVARPEKGSRHNRGCAVDVTLVDAAGDPLPMPTPFDDFSEKAHHGYMDLPPDVLENRATLKQAMMAEGFTPIDAEWWHYDAPGWREFVLLDENPWHAPLFPDD